MPEHIHIILEPPRIEPPVMPRLLRSLKQPVGQRCIAALRARGEEELHERLKTISPT